MLEINLALDMVVFFVAQSAKNELNTAVRFHGSIRTYPLVTNIRSVYTAFEQLRARIRLYQTHTMRFLCLHGWGINSEVFA